MLLSEEANRTELQGLKTVLHNMPMPVYCRTSGNKIAYANRVFAGLYGMQVSELIGSYHNFLLKCDMCPDNSTTICPHRVERDNRHNLLALETQQLVDYTETAMLADGTQVLFRCTEKPIVLGLFKYTTVVYMFPMQADGTVLLDTDGDGTLSKQDLCPSDPPELSSTLTI